MKFKRPFALVLSLVVLTIVVRCYRITNPVADWHAFRQADTASVTREYVKRGVDLLHPTYHDLSNIQSGQPNLEGWRMVEFPFVNGLVAFLVRLLPFLDLVLVSRFTSILFSAGTTVSLYYLVRRISGEKIALLSTLAWAILPFSIYYGRTVLPEPAMLFFSTASLWFFSRYLDQRQTWMSFTLAAICLALALLLKPFVAFLGPVFLSLTILKYGKKIYLHPELLLFVTLVFGPLYWWRRWVEQFPSGIPANDWLFNSNDIRLRPAWFRWLFYERLTKLMLGYWGWLLVVFNFQLPRKKWDEIIIYGSWGVGLLIYMVVIATGNVQHDYYQVITLPFVSILLGRGAWMFYRFWKKILGGKNTVQLTAIVAFLTLITAWYQVKGYFNVNHWEYVHVGKIVDGQTPPTAKVIAPAFGDTIFLFQTNRTGWPIGFEISDKINQGATHYVSTSYDDEARELEKKYLTVSKTADYILLDLTKPLESD